MNYEFVLNDLYPTQDEIESVRITAEKVIGFLNKTCEKESIPAEAMAVGSVAKKTWLSGKSDIDIFIHFPLDYDMQELKEKGLYLGYKTNDAFNGVASEHYASHPYLTCDIDGFEVDIVPCYSINDGSQLKSAVDRTILHTKYIQAHLREGQEREVLLLKRFMDCVGTYGSEFKTGGFAGYLCELLILKYDSFENTLRQARDWSFHTIIDLEDYGTADNKLFKKDPLVMIDPTDKNRNVAAALRKERMVDFMVASRNFINIIDNDEISDEIKQFKVLEFFKPLQKPRFANNSLENIKKSIIDEFDDRESQTLIITFPISKEISADALHPQLLKTVESIVEKLNEEEFSVFSYDYWTDENKIVVFIIELNVFEQSKYYIHEGPKVWNRIACENFAKKWGDEVYYNGEFAVLKRKRLNNTAVGFIDYILKKENVHIIKVGKNIKKALCNEHGLYDVDEFLNNLDESFDLIEDDLEMESLELDLLNTLDDLMNQGQYVKR